MSVTVDASVWVAASSDAEPHHAECRAFLEKALEAGAEFQQPALSLVEVCAAVARKTRRPALGLEAGALMLTTPGLVLNPLDLDAARQSAEVASATLLKCADAVYVATAQRAGASLVTLDRELRERAQPLVATMWPAEW